MCKSRDLIRNVRFGIVQIRFLMIAPLLPRDFTCESDVLVSRKPKLWETLRETVTIGSERFERKLFLFTSGITCRNDREEFCWPDGATVAFSVDSLVD